jgi:hypothetical protein
MAPLLSNSGVNHAKGVADLAESRVRHAEVNLHAMAPISLNLRKIAHFPGRVPIGF